MTTVTDTAHTGAATSVRAAVAIADVYPNPKPIRHMVHLLLRLQRGGSDADDARC